MSNKSFFKPQYFSPSANKVLAKYCSLKSEQQNPILLKFYTNEQQIEYELSSAHYVIFLPNNILQYGYHFGKINGNKKLIAQIVVTDDTFPNLIKDLGGSIKRKSKRFPTLGDLLDQK